MGNRINIYVLASVFLMFTATGNARQQEYKIKNDTIHHITIYFGLNQSSIDRNYTGNINTTALLDKLLTDSLQVSCLDSITVFAYTSPEGSIDSNYQLSAGRSESVRAYLQQHYPHLNPAIIITHNKGEDWNGFRNKVINDAQLPDKEEVIALMNYHSQNKEKQKRLLKHLNGGKTYAYIKSHILPELRRAEVTIYNLESLQADEACSTKSEVWQDTTAYADRTIPVVESSDELILTESSQPESRRVLVAIKNNLLYDLALAPNIEVEVPLGRTWSVNAEYKSPWWCNNGKHRCYQMISGGVEGRYWLGNRQKRNQLTGHFLGLYGEGGNYDFQFGGDGYRGKYYMASGLTYGYAKQLGKHLSIEFSLGVGYLTTEYRKYTPYEDDLVGVKYGQFNWIGPTKAKISLVWLITAGR